MANLHGDEFMKVLTTADGHAVVKGDDGYYHYATFGPDGSRICSGYRIGGKAPADILAASHSIPWTVLKDKTKAVRKDRRDAVRFHPATRGASPIKRHCIVILAQFQDISFTGGETRRSDFVNLITKEGTKSVLDYFNDQFQGQYEFNFTIGPVVTLSKNHDYYGKNDEDKYLYVARGTAKAAAADLEGAKADFDKAINMDRGNYELILEIAQIMSQYGAKNVGEGYLAGAGNVEGMDPVLKGKILYFLEDYKGALDLLAQFSGSDEAAALIVCRCHIALGDTQAAKEVIDSFGSKADSSPVLLGLLGSILMKQNKYSEAAEVYERAVTAAKGTSDIQNTLYNRIVAYEYAGDFEKARDLLTEYLKQYSGDEEAKREMKFLKTR